MRQLKIKSLEEQFNECISRIFDSFDEYPEQDDRLIESYIKLSNALGLRFNTVSVLVWALCNEGNTYASDLVANQIGIPAWEVNRAIDELGRLSYMEAIDIKNDIWDVTPLTTKLMMNMFQWYFTTNKNML